MSILQELSDLVEIEGYAPGTPEFSARLSWLKAERCRQIRSVPSCEACDHVEYCELTKEVARSRRNGVRQR